MPRLNFDQALLKHLKLFVMLGSRDWIFKAAYERRQVSNSFLYDLYFWIDKM